MMKLGRERSQGPVVSTGSTDGWRQARPAFWLDRWISVAYDEARPGVPDGLREVRRAAAGRVGPGRGVSGSAVAADQLLLVGELAAVVDQEAAHAGELVLLAGHHLDRQLLVREVSAGQLEGLGGFRLVLVDLPGVLVVTTRLEFFDALFGLVFLVLARCVVVGGHACVFSLPIRAPVGRRPLNAPSGACGAPIVPDDRTNRISDGAVFREQKVTYPYSRVQPPKSGVLHWPVRALAGDEPGLDDQVPKLGECPRGSTDQYPFVDDRTGDLEHSPHLGQHQSGGCVVPDVRSLLDVGVEQAGC